MLPVWVAAAFHASPPPALMPISNVVVIRSSAKVLRVYAPRIITGVQDMKAIWDRPDKFLIANTMRKDFPINWPASPIAFFV